MKTKGIMVALGALSAMMACGAWNYDKVDVVDLDYLERVVASWKPATVPDAPRKVLLFSEAFGYNHHGGRCYGDWTFQRAGERTGAWKTVRCADVSKLADAEYLSGFDAILFNNSTGVSEKLAPGLTKALSAFLKGGKGVALIHSGLDAFKDSDSLLVLFGGYFRGHPWHADGTWRFLNEQGAHPVNASFRHLPTSFEKVDEIYQFPAFFDRSTCTVLLSMDLSDPVTNQAEEWWAHRFGPASTRPDRDYAVSWVKTVGKGRVFYTSFGHDRNAFLDQDRLHHMFNGLAYALFDEAPPSPAKGPAIPCCRTDWANGPWREKLEAEIKVQKGKALDFVVVGDSITMGWRYPAADRWSGGKEVWDRHFGTLATLNLGMSGDRTEHLLWRMQDGGQADGWKAKTIFVMIGINNAGKGTVPDTVAEGAAAVVDALKAKHPESRIVVFGALPCARKMAWVKAYNEALAASLRGRAVFADVNARFAHADGTIASELFRDGLHPNPAGYEVLAAEIERLLKASTHGSCHPTAAGR